MKGLKEAAPEELDVVRRRALRSLAMGRIEQVDCDIVVRKIDELKGHIYNMQEREET